MHVAPVRPQVENGVADQLARAVVRHVAATSRFVDLDAKAVELGRRRTVGGQEDMIEDLALDMAKEQGKL